MTLFWFVFVVTGVLKHWTPATWCATAALMFVAQVILSRIVGFLFYKGMEAIFTGGGRL